MLPRLPKVPTQEELENSIPKIEPLPSSASRPFWSVMIPSYNRPHYLRRALTSVLAQDPGPERMQIEVVDNCSTVPGIKELVDEVSRGRVSFWHQPENVGAVNNFNTCLARSRGQWVHLLHDDDMVLPEFYHAYEEVICQMGSVAMIAGQAITVNESDEWTGISLLLTHDANEVKNFCRQNAFQNTVLAPAMVVSRSTYEKVGGYSNRIAFTPDWDMWVRAALAGPVGWVGRPLCLYRVHSHSDTSKLTPTGINIEDCYLQIVVNKRRLSAPKDLEDEYRSLYSHTWRERLANIAETTAWRMDAKESFEGRLNQARWAWRLAPNFRRLKLLFKSWIKCWLRGKQVCPTPRSTIV